MSYKASLYLNDKIFESWDDASREAKRCARRFKIAVSIKAYGKSRWVLSPKTISAASAKHIWIYLLTDRRSKKVCYVGQSYLPKQRLAAYKSRTRLLKKINNKDISNPLDMWFKELSLAGVTPDMSIYRRVECQYPGCNCSYRCEKATKEEQRVIAEFQNTYQCELCNTQLTSTT